MPEYRKDAGQKIAIGYLGSTGTYEVNIEEYYRIIDNFFYDHGIKGCSYS